MATVLLFPMAVGVFVLQLVLCFRARRPFVKLLPGAVLLAGEVLCGAACLVCRWLETEGVGIYGAVFAAVIMAVILAVLLAGDGLAWGIWAIVKSVQKRKK